MARQGTSKNVPSPKAHSPFKRSTRSACALHCQPIAQRTVLRAIQRSTASCHATQSSIYDSSGRAICRKRDAAHSKAFQLANHPIERARTEAGKHADRTDCLWAPAMKSQIIVLWRSKCKCNTMSTSKAFASFTSLTVGSTRTKMLRIFAG